MDPGLNQLLKWGIENTPTGDAPPNGTAPTDPPDRNLNAAALNALLGGPSDADLIKSSISALSTPTLPLPSRLTAADNLEQLIESLDNANLLSPLGLWPQLFALLADPAPEIRMMAAWCVGTAVQNNLPAQTAAFEVEVGGKKGGGLEQIVEVARGDGDASVRGKAVRAVSSWVRNFQAGGDKLGEVLGKKVDAGDMEAVDRVVGRLREEGEGRGG